jgi:enoyl-CoA hydratase
VADIFLSAEQVSLRDGLLFEGRLYHATFGLIDSKEGMSAFIEKRSASWCNV